jgi:dephospho-CoA kinase
MFVGLCGFAGSGKGTVAEFLRSKGCSHYSIKEIIAEELRNRGMEVNRENLIMMANSLRSQHGPDVLVQRVIKQLPQDGNAVIESLRNPEEVSALRANGNFILIAVDAPIQSRLQRLVGRSRPGDPLTLDDLRRLDGQEEADSSRSGIRIKECISMADFIIVNDGNLARLQTRIDEILSRSH